MTGASADVAPPGRLTGKKKPLLIAGVALCLVVIAVFAPPWTVKSIDDVNATSAVAGSENLDPAKYVASIWETRLLPAVAKGATDMPSLLEQLRRNRKAAVEEHGNVASLGGAPAFLVKGKGRVVSVDTEALISVAGISFGSGARPDVFFEIGPILSGTDVRDALKFIDFNRFENQVQYEEVGIEINSRLRDTVLSKIDPAMLKGKQVEFTGAFSYSDPKKIVFTPVTLEVKNP